MLHLKEIGQDKDVQKDYSYLNSSVEAELHQHWGLQGSEEAVIRLGHGSAESIKGLKAVADNAVGQLQLVQTCGQGVG